MMLKNLSNKDPDMKVLVADVITMIQCIISEFSYLARKLQVFLDNC